jgi:hypothetical protein
MRSKESVLELGMPYFVLGLAPLLYCLGASLKLGRLCLNPSEQLVHITSFSEGSASPVRCLCQSRFQMGPTLATVWKLSMPREAASRSLRDPVTVDFRGFPSKNPVPVMMLCGAAVSTPLAPRVPALAMSTGRRLVTSAETRLHGVQEYQDISCVVADRASVIKCCAAPMALSRGVR